MKVRLNLATAPLESNRRFAVGASVIGTLGLVALIVLSINAFSVWRSEKVSRTRQAALESQIAALQQQRQSLAAFFDQPETVKRRQRAAYLNALIQQRALVVAHSHGHGDHTAGDKGFTGLPDVTLVAATPEAEQKAFGITRWPEQPGSIDLGDRIVDVLAIPGHQPAHLAYYDRRTGILLTGDHLYPGRLYVNDFAQYLASTRRMVEFTKGRLVAHILGCHIEQSRTPYVDYPTGTKYQPEEHSLELGRAHLLELLDGLEKQTQVSYRDFTIVPRIRH